MHPISVPLSLIERCADAVENGRYVGLKLRQQCLSLKKEDASVPVIVVALNVCFSGFRLGFFDEMIRSKYAVSQFCAALDVTVTGFRSHRLHAERHNPAVLSVWSSTFRGGEKTRYILDQVIAGKNQ